MLEVVTECGPTASGQLNVVEYILQMLEVKYGTLS